MSEKTSLHAKFLKEEQTFTVRQIEREKRRAARRQKRAQPTFTPDDEGELEMESESDDERARAEEIEVLIAKKERRLTLAPDDDAEIHSDDEYEKELDRYGPHGKPGKKNMNSALLNAPINESFFMPNPNAPRPASSSSSSSLSSGAAASSLLRSGFGQPAPSAPSAPAPFAPSLRGGTSAASSAAASSAAPAPAPGPGNVAAQLRALPIHNRIVFEKRFKYLRYELLEIRRHALYTNGRPLAAMANRLRHEHRERRRKIRADRRKRLPTAFQPGTGGPGSRRLTDAEQALRTREDDGQEAAVNRANDQLDALERSGNLKFMHVVVDRAMVLKSTYDIFQAATARTLPKLRLPFQIQFFGEQGIDASGLTKEWLRMVMEQITDLSVALFALVAGSQQFRTINMNSSINEGHLTYFFLFGQLLAVALLNDNFISFYFTPFFFKDLIRGKVYLKDLEMFDAQMYKSMCSTLDMADAADLLYNFETELEVAIGDVQVVPLCEGGSEMEVTNENRKEFVALMTKRKLKFRTRRQMNAIRRGFNSIVPLRFLKIFSPDELALVFCGSEKLDVDDWEEYTDLMGYKKTSPEIVWFWEIVRDFSDEMKVKLLQFTTACSRLPPGGFKELSQMNGHRFTIDKQGDRKTLPTAHTCFNQLCLPPYPSKAEMARKLTCALEFGSTGEFDLK